MPVSTRSFYIIPELRVNENPEIKKLVILLCLYRVCLSLPCHLIAFKILVISSDLVDEASARYDLHDTVGCRLDDLMVS